MPVLSVWVSDETFERLRRAAASVNDGRDEAGLAESVVEEEALKWERYNPKPKED